ncbi:hypothetical protein [Kitasatospora sp. NPDC001132]
MPEPWLREAPLQEREFATTLQTTMLPRRIPEISSGEVAGRLVDTLQAAGRADRRDVDLGDAARGGERLLGAREGERTGGGGPETVQVPCAGAVPDSATGAMPTTQSMVAATADADPRRPAEPARPPLVPGPG